MGRLSRIVLLSLPLLPVADTALAHAAIVQAREVPGILVEARYETGQPMVDAQVTVFGPADPARPAMTGQTDGAGRFRFVPTPGETGAWAVQVRQAGHGAMVTVAVSDPQAPARLENSPASAFTTTQRLIMAVAVVWGFVGTALFFTRRGREHART